MSPNQSLNTNQVGYAQKNLRSGAMIVTPQFLGIATENGKIDLQSMTCRNEDSDAVSIRTLDQYGRTVNTYLWINYYGDNEDETCWVDSTYEKPETDVYFEPGQGLWVQGISTANAFTTSGQVSSSDVVVQLQSGATMTGNSSPVEIDLQDIFCRSDDSDQVSIRTLDQYDRTVSTYLWINYYGDNEDESCWVDSTYEKPETAVKFAPGEGLWVQGSSTANCITFPGVEL